MRERALAARRHFARRAGSRRWLGRRGDTAHTGFRHRPSPNHPTDGVDVAIRVLIADDQEIVRAGLVTLLDAQPDIQVIGPGCRRPAPLSRSPASCGPTCACSTSACLTSTESRPPDSSPGQTSTIRWRLSSSPPSTSTSTCYGALKAGARGFLLKDAGPALLTQADPRGRSRRRTDRPERHRPAPRQLRPRRPWRAAAAAHRTAHQP